MGLRSAATAACCATAVAFVVLCPCTMSSALMSGTGASDQPMRHPVIAKVFDTPSTMTMRSRRSGAIFAADSKRKPSYTSSA